MEFAKSVNLARELIRTDFKLRYHGSYLGYLWSFLNPLMMFGVLFIVFSKFLKINYEDYALHLFLGIILWNFFSEATAGAMSSILEKGGLIKKIYFPREIIIFSSVAVSFIVLVSNLMVFTVFYLFLKHTFDFKMFIFLGYLVELCLITLGFSLILSALYPKFRDLFHMWQVVLQVGFWATPITYSFQIIPDKYKGWLLLNPFADIIEGSRVSLISHQSPDILAFIYGLAVSAVIVSVGYYIFIARVPFFTEEI